MAPLWCRKRLGRMTSIRRSLAFRELRVYACMLLGNNARIVESVATLHCTTAEWAFAQPRLITRAQAAQVLRGTRSLKMTRRYSSRLRRLHLPAYPFDLAKDSHQVTAQNLVNI